MSHIETHTWNLTEGQVVLYTEDQHLANLAVKTGLREMCRYWKDGKYFAIQFVGPKDIVQKVISHAESSKQEQIEVTAPNPFNVLAEEVVQNMANVFTTEQSHSNKKCVTCGELFIANSNSQKYCPKCRKEAYAESHRRAVRKHYRKNKNKLRGDYLHATDLRENTSVV